MAHGLALGAFHSCAVFHDGSVRCWGSGPYHGYGGSEVIGDDEVPSIAGDLDVGGDVVSLTASWYHSCVVLVDGGVRCWGDNSDGRLGYGHTQSVATPAAGGDVDVGGPVAQISVGPAHTCACRLDGKVRCWGSNQDGQLGYADSGNVGDDETPAEAGDVDVGGFAVQVAAGFDYSCALRDDGGVRCWGGVPPHGGEGDVDLGGSAVQIVAGIHHVCALLDGGMVRCWGNAQGGALGYGSIEMVGDDETPAEAGDVDVGGDVAELAAGDFGACALLTNGKVRCWGSGDNGELGYGSLETIGDGETPAEAGDVDVGGIVTSIDMGFLHTCAVLESGKVRCWGRGITGALGYGNEEDIGDDELPVSAGDVETH